jgi:PIN domain nuclease of toxin-antitoxin system
MKILIDTHAFLWLIDGDPRLSNGAKKIFLDNENALFLSAASLWEISIKLSLGKLKLARNWISMIISEMTANRIQWLSIEIEHCAELSRLPFLHRDPFDRMLVSQALVEDMSILSHDVRLSDYPIQRVWHG